MSDPMMNRLNNIDLIDVSDIDDSVSLNANASDSSDSSDSSISISDLYSRPAANFGEDSDTDSDPDYIDMLIARRVHSGSAVNRVPEAVIDLTSLESPSNQIETIDFDLSDFVPTNRRRSHASSETPTAARATLDIDESAPSAPKRKRKDQDQDQDLNPDDVYKCPVCLEIARHREPLSTKCGHVFCRQCIEKAIITFQKCPLCQKKCTLAMTRRIFL
ncbi:E3 ubiquitin-protein ligase RNF4-like [Drosophila subobscura]|uniref:E3 ubiquitin-protein ligase RNF4-like n=1 Tax=Drosophila subobscura TaxID=7241 RepID=UPI00155B28D4|nr:E3 ubiquitin-protein ligase RNF4-like [Drosophila subobscura]